MKLWFLKHRALVPPFLSKQSWSNSTEQWLLDVHDYDGGGNYDYDGGRNHNYDVVGIIMMMVVENDIEQ